MTPPGHSRKSYLRALTACSPAAADLPGGPFLSSSFSSNWKMAEGDEMIPDAPSSADLLCSYGAVEHGLCGGTVPTLRSPWSSVRR